MPTLRTLVINRPVDQVFAFFADPANDMKWRPHVKEISADGPIRVGSKIHQVIAGPRGRGIPADIEVTACDPAARYAFRVTAGPARPVGEYLFSPDGDGTAVTFSLHAQLSGIKKLLMSKPVQNSMNGEMAALDTAKGVIEGT
jgi:uncharacterized protein YndB with AHSA1/START domain